MRVRFVKARSLQFARRRAAATALLACALAVLAVRPARAQSGEDSATDLLKGMSLAQLTQVNVTSVSKTAQPLSDAPAAIYVISHDDIVRSGATSLPEVLRLAPNLQVVQISPSNYTITARGFSGNSADQNFSDKLLVLIDGRSVYSPLYSGVYWDAQQVVLDDVDRIEIISGPGATLWGANAVNGVINIITRRASETQGAMVELDGGSLEKDATARFGGALGENASYRAYASGFKRDSFQSVDGADADDGWWKSQAGFRGDWQGGQDHATLQGDLYRANESAPGQIDTALAGANLQGRWQRTLGADSALQVQAYYDQTQRFTIDDGAFVLDIYDLELQHSLALGSQNQLVWGAGERISRYGITDAISPVSSLLFVPDQRTLALTNFFAQDTLLLTGELRLILGLKLEDDPYSHVTPLPNVRLAWKPTDGSLLWGAVSRAIRSPTPFDRDVAEYLGSTLFIVGGPDFQPEQLTAYELGYRGAVGSQLSFSASLYYNWYDHLRSIEFGPTEIPLQWGNKMQGDTYGAEIWGDYQALPWWRLSFGINELREDLRFVPGSSQLLGTAQAGDDPSHELTLRSAMTFSQLTLDLDFRNVARLPNPAVPGYTEMNARVGWQLSRQWNLALAGANLLHAHHVEFPAPAEQISRSVLFEVRFSQ